MSEGPGEKDDDGGRWIAAAAFGAIVLLLWPLPFLGIDLSDTGLHLYAQELTVRSGEAPYLWWWLSDHLGGWWLVLSDRFGLVGARMGGLLCVALSGGFAVATAGRLLGRAHWTLAFAAVAIAPIARPLVLMPHYQSIPVVLATAFVWACSILVQRVAHGRKATGPALAGGVLLAALINAKLTCATAMVLPVLVTVLFGQFDRPRLRAAARANGLLVSTAVLSCLLLFAWVAATQGLDSLTTAPSVPDQRGRHTALAILARIFTDVELASPALAVIVVGAALLGALLRRTPGLMLGWLVAGTAVVCIGGLASSPGLATLNRTIPVFLHLQPYGPWALSNFLLLYLVVLDLTLLVALVRSTAIARRDLLGHAVLALFALAMPIVAGFGSAVGLGKLRLGMTLLVVLLPALVLKWSEITSAARVWRPALVAFLAVIAGTSLAYGYTQVYMGSHDLRHYTYRFESGRVAGARTRPRRGESFDELMRQIEAKVEPGDTILAYDNLPFLYYATRCEAWGGLVWPRLRSIEILEAELEAARSAEPPVLIVRSKAPAYYPFHYKPGMPLLEEPETYRLIRNEMRKRFQPTLVWENPNFQILVPTGRGRKRNE